MSEESKKQAVDEAARLLAEIDAERGHDRQTPLDPVTFRPISRDTSGMLSMRLPAILFQVDDRMGVVLNLYTHPDLGVIFDADIRFEDGKVEPWRGRNMKGKFFFGEYMGPRG